MTTTDWHVSVPGPQSAGPPPHPETPVPPSRRRISRRTWLVAGGSLVAAAALGAVAVAFAPSARTMQIGACVTETGANPTRGEGSWEVVDCRSDEARYRVVGRDPGEQTYEEFTADPDTCADSPAAEYFLWAGAPDAGRSGAGVVYCAERLRRPTTT